MAIIFSGRMRHWTGFATVALLFSLGSPGFSSTVQPDSLGRTQPMKQTFLTRGASVVEKGNLQSCRVFSAIDVRASKYISNSGEHVSFTEVERSPAAGLWIIGKSKPVSASVEPVSGVSEKTQTLRVVLKYPIEELHMETEAWTVSLRPDLDPAGDSVTLSAINSAHLQAAWLSGSTVRFVGRSRDTGRTIKDVILPPEKIDVEACATFEAGSPLEESALIDFSEALPTFGTTPGGSATIDDGDANWQSMVFDPAETHYSHHGLISVVAGARLPNSPEKSELIGCRMTDLGGEIERYRLSQIKGFISQSSEVWITRDVEGLVRQVYIPGVFEALRKLGTDIWTADVSVAAFANDPFGAPVSKGCLGSQRFSMASPGGLLAGPQDGSLATFAGSALAAPGSMFGYGVLPTTVSGAMPDPFRVSGGGSPTSSSIIFFGDTLRTGEPLALLSHPRGSDGAELAPVPLPPGMLLFISGLGFFGLLRNKSARQRAG